MYVKEAIAYAIASFLRYSIQVSKGRLYNFYWQIFYTICQHKLKCRPFRKKVYNKETKKLQTI